MQNYTEDKFMIIIEKKDFELYRYLVAKIVFLKVYRNEYTYITNIPGSNCILVENNKKRQLIISLFKKPDVNLQKRGFNSSILIYYQKAAYGRYEKKENKRSINRMLSETFDLQYNSTLTFAVLNTNKFIIDHTEFDFLLDELIQISSIVYEKNDTLYKYYSNNKVQNNNYNVNDGTISFLNPKHFNDPFDCSCLLANQISISDKFRVFCTIQDERNILMWSYYGSEHKGYCFEYSKDNIIKTLLNSNINGLCIIGNIQYSDKRPNYKSPYNFLSYSNIKFLIDCTFTKYKKWEHEEEYRFVIISDYFNDDGNATCFNVKINNVFSGYQSSNPPIMDSKNNIIPVNQLQKDDLDYKLI